MLTCGASIEDERVRGTTCCTRLPPLEAKKALLACDVGVREKSREQGQEEVKLVFVDVQQAHLNAICDEEEWVVLTKSDEQTEDGHAMMTFDTFHSFRTRATQCVDVTKLSTNAL